jgi:hypothetical protein
VNRRVARGSPARGSADLIGVIVVTNEKVPAALGLRVAAEAKIWIRLGEQLAVDRPVRLMAGGAAFAQGFMFEDKSARLLSMAGRALLVEP